MASTMAEFDVIKTNKQNSKENNLVFSTIVKWLVQTPTGQKYMSMP